VNARGTGREVALNKLLQLDLPQSAVFEGIEFHFTVEVSSFNKTDVLVAEIRALLTPGR
jgi:hypothetical protein